MTTEAKRMSDLFRGLDRAHGRSVVGDKVDPRKGKRNAKSWTVLEPVTLDLWKQHLAGEYGMGIIPITDDATAQWGAIDVDQYDMDLDTLVSKIEDLRLPMVVCRTKSGGAHVYLFLTEPASAQLVRSKLTDMAVAIGYPGVEVFPKQVSLAHERDVGSWLNMPYFGGDDSPRHAIVDGKALTISQFLDRAEKRRITPDQLLKLDPPVKSEFQDGPPCLQQLSTHGFPDGTRNNSLFNLGVYARLKWPDDWERKVEEYNHEYMDPPLNSGEVQATIKSLKRKAYRYRCDEPPICNACNRGLCLGRKFGVAGGGDDEPHDVQLGNLTKYTTDPPLYVLDVDGHRLELGTEELLDHSKFRKRCFEYLNKLPPRRKPATWDKVVQSMMANLEEVEAPADASPDGRVWQLLEDWCTQYGSAKSREELLMGKPWTEEGQTYFRSADFQRFLDHQGIRDIKGRRLWGILRKHGAKHGEMNVSGRCVRYWSVPSFDLQDAELSAPRKGSEY